MIPVSRDSRARRGYIIGSLLGLCTLMTLCRYGHCASSSDSKLVDSSTPAVCPAESAFCLGSTACVGCAEILQGVATSTIDLTTDYGDCDTFVVTVCGLVEDAGCDWSSSTLLDLVGCLAKTVFGCPDFSTCDIDTADTSYAVSVAPIRVLPLNRFLPLFQLRHQLLATVRHLVLLRQLWMRLWCPPYAIRRRPRRPSLSL